MRIKSYLFLVKEDEMIAAELEKKIRAIPDFPVEGVLFRDITTLLKDEIAYKTAMDAMLEQVKNIDFNLVVGIESRGFIFGSLFAYLRGTGFAPVRKKGKLPSKTKSVSYDLEYGQDILEIHEDAVSNGMKVLIVDDLLATGGTSAAVVKLIESLGGEVVGLSYLVELDFLNGREKLQGKNIFSLIHY